MHLKDLIQTDFGTEFIFFRALTRASIKISIIISDFQLAQCQEPEKMTPRNFQDCCLKQFYDVLFEELVRRVSEQPTCKPDCLFVGKKPVSSSVQKRQHQRSDLPNIEGLTEYVSGNRCFLHIDDLFEETSLEALRNFGIKKIFIFPRNWFQFNCYASTNKIIVDFTWKHGKPFEVEAFSSTLKVSSLDVYRHF